MVFLQLSESGALSANETDFAKSQEPKAKSRFEQGQVPSMAVQEETLTVEEFEEALSA